MRIHLKNSDNLPTCTPGMKNWVKVNREYFLTLIKDGDAKVCGRCRERLRLAEYIRNKPLKV